MTKIIICPSSLQSRDPILYGAADNKSDVSIFTCDKVSDLPSLDGITDITHIAFMYHMRASKSIPIEDDVNVTQYDDSGNPVGTEYDEFGEVTHMPSEEIGTEYRIFNKGIIEWITKMKETNSSLEIIDLLTCNIPSAIGNAERTIVTNETGLTLRYSLDQTGNSPNGNWVLESDGVDVKSLYFTDDIENWDDVLDNQLRLNIIDYAINRVDGYGSNIILNNNNDLYITVQNTTQVDASNSNTITNNDDILLFDDEFDFSGDFSVEFNFDINFNSSNKFVNFGIGLLDSSSNDTQIGFQLIDHWASITSTIQYDLYVDGDISTNTIPPYTNIVNGKFTITRTGSSISFVLTNNNDSVTLIDKTFTSDSVQSLSRLSIKNKAIYYEPADDNWQLVSKIHSLEANSSYVIPPISTLPPVYNLIDVDTTSEPGKTIYRLKNDINISTLVTDGYITDAANFYMHLAEDEIFDGSGHTIDCDRDNVTRTTALFTVQNVVVPGADGTEPIELTDAIFEDFPTIRNLNVTSAATDISYESLIVTGYSDTFYIHDVTLDITYFKGGISGFAGRYCSTFKIKDCVCNVTDYYSHTTNSGFIGQFCSGYKIVGCTTDGTINTHFGGICGSYQGYRDTHSNDTSFNSYITDTLYPGVKFRLVVDNCKHYGNVNNNSSGIVGSSFGHRISHNRNRSDVFDGNNYLIKDCVQDNGTIHVASGGICGQFLGNSSGSDDGDSYINIYINNCHSLKSDGAGYTISQTSGGIVARNYTGSAHNRKIYIEIKNCTNRLPIIVGHQSSNNYKGAGLIASGFCNSQNSSFLIQNCTNYGSIQVNQAGILQIGQVPVNISPNERVIDNCVNYGQIGITHGGANTSGGHSANGRAGGIVSCNANGSNILIRNCVNYGEMNDELSGGIAGGTFRESQSSSGITDDELSQKCVILHCVNEGAINANHCGGIIGGGDSITTTERDTTNNYDSSDYNAIRTPFVIDHCVNNGTLSTGLTGSGQLTGDKLYNVNVTRTIVPGNNRFSASYDYTENSDNPNPNAI